MPSASSYLGAQSYLANASAASASMPTDINLQKQGAEDEPFKRDTITEFEPSAYSNVLEKGLENIRTPVLPRPERFAQPEALQQILAQPAAKFKHYNSRTKRARHNSLTKSAAPAASIRKYPEACTLTPTRLLFSVGKVSARSIPCRKSAKQANASRRATSGKRTLHDWSNKGETKHPRPSSPAHQAPPAAKIGGQALIVESCSESAELSNINLTASRWWQRQSHAALHTKEQRQPSNGESPQSKALVTWTAALKEAAVEDEKMLFMTVTVPIKRKEIAKRTGCKVQVPLLF